MSINPKKRISNDMKLLNENLKNTYSAFEI